MQRPIAATPLTRASGKGLRLSKVRQQIRETPTLRPALKCCSVAALVCKRVDGAGSPHDLSSRVGNDAATEMPLRNGHITPISRTALELRPF